MARLKTLRPRLGTLDSRLGRLRQPAGLTAEQAYDRQRAAESPTRKLYGTRRWKALRLEQLRVEPLCRMCMAVGHVEAATHCDHLEPHRGDVAKFWAGPFQSLCETHHNRDKQREEREA